jgi:hypothetical protein
MGTVRELFPPGFSDLRDLPHTLFEAIRLASVFIAWEELPEEEQPPKRIWLNARELKAWFQNVKRNRANGASNSSPEIEDPVDNAAAQGLIVGG